MKEEKEVKNAEVPNVRFVGHHVNAGAKDVKPDEEGFVPREPITKFNEGEKLYTLPPVDKQKKPFYFAEASRLLRLFPILYKENIEKGS